LTDLVSDHLARELDALEASVAKAWAAAAAEHLRQWPHDVPGSETAACLEGRDQADRALAALYVETVAWASDVLGERIQSKPRRHPPCVRPPERARPLVELEPPAVVAEAQRPRARFGWRQRGG
jgi:hypothetical protein